MSNSVQGALHFCGIMWPRSWHSPVLILKLEQAQALWVIGLDAVGGARGVVLLLGRLHLMRSVIHQDVSALFALGDVFIITAVHSARWGVTQPAVMNIGGDSRWTGPGSACPYVPFKHAVDSPGSLLHALPVVWWGPACYRM